MFWFGLLLHKPGWTALMNLSVFRGREKEGKRKKRDKGSRGPWAVYQSYWSWESVWPVDRSSQIPYLDPKGMFFRFESPT